MSGGSQYRPILLKRKRRSPDKFSNIENEPVKQDEKKIKDDKAEEAGSSTDDRMPLTELSVLRIAAGKDQHENNCRSDITIDNERKQLFENEMGLVQTLEDVNTGKQSHTNLLSLTADEILAEEPLEHCDQETTPSKPQFRRYFGGRHCPLPKLNWAEEKLLWEYFCRRDFESNQNRDPLIFERHPNLQPRMRAVLLEWIIEVCDVYKLHRETYYLSMDYLDRYLNYTINVPKVQLQLIGITCLLIASKVEEIYPPKVSEFAYVTDGACSEDDILRMEITVMRNLEWKCSVLTANSWLCLYLQICYKENSREGMELLFPQYPSSLFLLIAQLLDLITLDIASLRYSYSVLAASCLYIVCSKHHALQVSGYRVAEIRDCINWVGAFWDAMVEGRKIDPPSPSSKVLPSGPDKNSVLDFSHALQTHTVTLDLLEAAHAILELRSGPPQLDLLTPPSSSKKETSAKLNQD